MDLIIAGVGGFGREVLWAAREDVRWQRNPHNKEVDFEDIWFVDDNQDIWGTTVCGAIVLGDIEHIYLKDFRIICGVGSPDTKRKFVSRVKYQNFKFATVVHGSVNMSDYVEIGEGTVICAGCNITTQVKIGNHAALNLDCSVGHDVVIDDYANISPGVHISGYVHIGEGVDIGTGANILPHVTIGEGSIIGAGACVTKDIPSYSLAVGVPAVVKKSLK